jgi:uncharacterized damage-inducible protein DinB
MACTAHIRHQLSRSLNGGAWHGPAVLEVLEGVGWSQAVSRPIRGAHSIAELVLHVTTWMRGVRERLCGDWLDVSDEEDFPGQPSDPAGWLDAKQALMDEAASLDRAIADLDEEALSQPAPHGEYSLESMLYGLVQHNLYHAGQMAILRKGRVD